MALSIIFVLSLTAISVQSVAEAIQERKDRSGKRMTASKSDWAEVARALDLEVMARSGLDNPALRGTILGHWVSVEERMNDIEIEVNYRSGISPFEVREPGKERADSGERFVTGDEAFETRLAVLTHSTEEMAEYLSPARRNALLWLRSAFELGNISDGCINVMFTNLQWNTEELISAITLVVDDAEIMEAGQKVFMAPPTAGDETNLELVTDA